MTEALMFIPLVDETVPNGFSYRQMRLRSGTYRIVQCRCGDLKWRGSADAIPVEEPISRAVTVGKYELFYRVPNNMQLGPLGSG
jgi:hypothetical protein